MAERIAASKSDAARGGAPIPPPIPASRSLHVLASERPPGREPATRYHQSVAKPSSTRRRTASANVGLSSCCAAQCSTAARNSPDSSMGSTKRPTTADGCVDKAAGRSEEACCDARTDSLPLDLGPDGPTCRSPTQPENRPAGVESSPLIGGCPIPPVLRSHGNARGATATL